MAIAVGVLALQGDFLEHLVVLRSLGADALEVRLPADLEAVQGLIIPGGESTTMARLMDIYGLRDPVVQRARAGMPLWGTCAGLILLARRLRDDRPVPLGLMDIEVQRNAFGRQVDSFETDIVIRGIDDGPFRAVFIRAPIITGVGRGVEVLASLEDGRPVAVRQGNLLGTAFHPELTDDTRVHRYFLKMVEESVAGQGGVGVLSHRDDGTNPLS